MSKPEILARRDVCASRLFTIEQQDLKFSNGNLAQYEKIKTRTGEAVALIPMLKKDTVLLIREYAGGFEDYYMSLVKGAVDAGMSVLEAANRELKEEVGFAAKRLKIIKTMASAPGHLDVKMHIVLAEDLSASRLDGDEPEPLEVIAYKLSELDTLLQQPDCVDACSIAALLWMKNFYG